MAYSGSYPYMGHVDGMHAVTNMGVIGTLGTADTGGTALMLPTAVDPNTGAAYNQAVAYGTSYGTVGTASQATWGTLIPASGVGTRTIITGLTVSGVSGTTEVAITTTGVDGSFGAGVLVRAQVHPGIAAISRDYSVPKISGTNGTIAFWMGTAGTVDITVDYFQQ